MKRILKVSILILLAVLCSAALREIVTLNNSRYNASLLANDSSSSMSKPFSVIKQYIAPQKALTRLAGWLGEARQPWLKNHLIGYFLKRFDVNMQEAVIEDPYDYPSFNSFFTRQLKPNSRPIAKDPEIASPADGFVSQIGKIHQETLLQAKGFYYELNQLLGGSKPLAERFANGSFATIYLSPKDYHRVHMPFAGALRETIFIPGQLFSVNQETAAAVPNLFARNERLVCIFDTEIGPMAVILVGAMLVGSIETVWHANTTANKMTVESYDGSLKLAQGAELGHFKMGSTAIVLFAKDAVEWNKSLQENTRVLMGEAIGHKKEKG